MNGLTVEKLHCAVCNDPPVYIVFDVLLCGRCSGIADAHKIQVKAEMTQALIGLVVRLTPPTVENKP
jgi:hypothetical protein